MTEQCNSMECSTQVSCDCSSSEQECPCGGQGCPGCNTNINPIDFASTMWHKAGFEAINELKKEKVKAKMEAAF